MESKEVMTTQPNDWLVVFRIKFEETINATDTQFLRPAGPSVWRFGPENVQLDENGLPIFKAQSWGGIALYKDRATANHHAANPTALISPSIATLETWSALLEPFRHAGAVNWRGNVESSSAVVTSQSKSSGPLAVITSAGFISQDAAEMPRIKAFTTGSKKILARFKQDSELIEGAIFYSMYDQLDGITLTLWPNEQAMLKAAYQNGLHAELMHKHRDQAMADRISNTRANIIKSYGTWDQQTPC